MDLDKIFVSVFGFFLSVAFWTNLLDLIVSVKQKLSFIIKNARGGREEVYFMVWKKFTPLTELAVIDKDLRGIYSRIDVSSSIAHTCVF